MNPVWGNMEDPEGKTSPILFQDHTPVFTSWKQHTKSTDGEEVTVWVFQLEGGRTDGPSVEAFYGIMENHIIPTKGRFITLYDLRAGLSNFIPYVFCISQFIKRVRPSLLPLRTIVIAPDLLTRNIVRFLCSMGGSGHAYVITDDIDEAWKSAYSGPLPMDKGMQDAYGNQSLSEGMMGYTL